MQKRPSNQRFAGLAERYRVFWHQSPYKMASLAFLLGALPILAVLVVRFEGFSFNGILDSALLVRHTSEIKFTEVQRFKDRTDAKTIGRLDEGPVVRLGTGVYLVDSRPKAEASGFNYENVLILDRQKGVRLSIWRPSKTAARTSWTGRYRRSFHPSTSATMGVRDPTRRSLSWRSSTTTAAPRSGAPS